MMSKLVTVLWLLAVWLVLLESTSAGAVLVGLVVAVVLATVVGRTPRDEHRQQINVRPHLLLHYGVTFLGLLTWANVLVAWAVIAPKRAGVNRAVVRVPIAPMPDSATMILANAISLTPGTFILEIVRDPTRFYVHILQYTSDEDVLEDIWGLQRRLARGLGLDVAVATIDRWTDELRAGGVEALSLPGPGDEADPERQVDLRKER